MQLASLLNVARRFSPSNEVFVQNRSIQTVIAKVFARLRCAAMCAVAVKMLYGGEGRCFLSVLAVPTLVSRDDGDVFGSRRHTENLVAVNSALHLGQVSEGAGDSRREVWNMTHLD